MAKSSTSVWERNYAENAQVREMIESAVVPLLDRTLDDRLSMQQDWRRFVAMWNVKHDEMHMYRGRAKLFIPEVRKNVEAQARQLTEAAFPREDFFDVDPGPDGTMDGAKVWKSTMRWYMDQAGLRPKFHVFARQQALLGTSPVYVPWSKKMEQVMRSAKGKNGKIVPSRKLVELYQGPDFVPRDLFRWFAINPKATNLDDGCFEDYIVSLEELKRRRDDGILAGFDDLEKGWVDPYAQREFTDDLARANDLGLQLEASASYNGTAFTKDQKGDVAPQFRRYMCRRVFIKLVLPQAIDTEAGEDPNHSIPLMLEIYNGKHVGLVRRNPFWHQRPPYVVGKYILPMADDYYGQGIPQSTQYMQYELNSTAEQVMDSKTLALNPLAIIDPALASAMGDFDIAPGAKWFVPPNAVKFSAMPDLTAVGYNAMGHLKAAMQDYSDRSPALPPELQGKARSATQADGILQTMNIDNKCFSLQNEIMVLQPLMEQWEYLIDQHMDDDQIVMILGKNATQWKRSVVSKDAMLGRYRYTWKATAGAMNKSIQARQIMDLMRVVGTLPPDQVQQLGFQFAEAVRMLAEDVWEMPDADKLFTANKQAATTDPEVEHRMLKLGMSIEVQPGDNDVLHAKDHLAEKESGKLNEQQMAELDNHMLQHNTQFQAKLQAQQQARQMQIAQMQMNAQAQAQGGGQDPRKQGTAMGSGNRTQLSPNASVGNMASGQRP